MRPIFVFLIILAIVVGFLILFYILGRRQQKKRDEQQELIDQTKQSVSMLIIDKKKIRLKDSGLPQSVIDQTPKFARRSKVPVVKAKVGPKIQLFIADVDIYNDIPVKKEVKAWVSGIYIVEVRGLHGKVEKPKKKKRFMARMMEKAQNGGKSDSSK